MATTVFLFAGTTSWTPPAGVTSVTVHMIGAGGLGGISSASSPYRRNGGGGGAYARRDNVAVTAGTAVNCNVPTKNAGNSAAGAWFGTNSIQAGNGANAAVATTPASGGAITGSPSAGFAGGNGGLNNDSSLCAGGGGAAGPNGSGINSTTTDGTSNSPGGAANNGATGGGSGGNAETSGGNGSIWSQTSNAAVAGPGGGAGGSSSTDNVNGGQYGGGGGGATSGTSNSGNGGDGVIVLIYTPSSSSSGSLTATMQPSSLAASGASGSVATGSLNQTMQPAALAASGASSSSPTGSLTKTMQASSVVASAATGNIATGALNQTMKAAALSAMGATGSPSGALTATLQPGTLSSKGTAVSASKSILPDLTKILIVSAGVGPFALGVAAAGFRGMDALIDGATYSYSVQQDVLFEYGQGVFSAASSSFSRTPIFGSNGAGALVAFDIGAALTFTALSSDYAQAGKDGLSAYQVWLAAGNIGTVGDFLSSIGGAVTAASIAAALGAPGATTADVVAPSRGMATTVGGFPAIIAPPNTPLVDVYGNTIVGDTAFQKPAYRPVATQPTHQGKMQDSKGNWYELVEKHVMPDWFQRTGDAGLGIAFQRAIDYLTAKGVNNFVLGPRAYDVTDMTVTMTNPINVLGTRGTENGTIAGVNDSASGFLPSAYGETTLGSVIIGGRTADYQFKSSGYSARRAFFDGMTFVSRQPAVNGSTWSPTPFQHMIASTGGPIEIGRVMMQGVTNGVYCVPGGQLKIDRLWGQIFTNAVYVDQAYDVVRIDELHNFTFANGSAPVVAYQQANTVDVRVGRCDGLHVKDFFSINGLRGFSFENLTNSGTAQDVRIDYLYADFHKHALYVDNGATSIHVGTLVGQCENSAAGDGSPLPGSAPVYFTGNSGAGLCRIDSLKGERFGSAGVYNASSSTITIVHHPLFRYQSTSAPLFSSPGGNPTECINAPIYASGATLGAYGTDYLVRDDSVTYNYQTTTDANGNVTFAHGLGVNSLYALINAFAKTKASGGNALPMSFAGMDGNNVTFAPAYGNPNPASAYANATCRTSLVLSRYTSPW